ncbi:MAG: hypothetical protein GY816_05055 [Cytophagales bacterium]|nr:hypothetical protein [Cytophagales bacterium]
MKFSKHKIAAALALFIGVMSVIAGSSVLLGISTPDYNVLEWLVGYNVLTGILAMVVSVLIWKKHFLVIGASAFMVAAHGSVLILLATVFSDLAAMESMKAMTFRIAIWIVILILNFKTSKNED